MAGKGKGPEKGRDMKKWYSSELWINLEKKNDKTSKSKNRSEFVWKKDTQHSSDYK